MQCLIDQPELTQILETYQALIEQAGEERSDDEQGVRWANRIPEISGVETAELSSLHGQLIAMGWLTFQLEGRNNGLMYRITAEGRKAIQWASLQADVVAEDEETVAEAA